MNQTDVDAARHPTHDLDALARKVRDLQTSLRELAQSERHEQLLKIIRRPGWTTPAEFLLVEAGIAQMQAQVAALNAFQAQVLRGADLVGRKG